MEITLEKYTFIKDEMVTWDPDQAKIPGGKGWIVCPATSIQLFGRIWVIELKSTDCFDLPEDYPFTAVCIPESLLKPYKYPELKSKQWL